MLSVKCESLVIRDEDRANRLPSIRLWDTIADKIRREALFEDESFPERNLAALVASKIYYHLQEYDESMVFALGAGKLFDIEHEGEFEDTIIGKKWPIVLCRLILTRFKPNA